MGFKKKKHKLNVRKKESYLKQRQKSLMKDKENVYLTGKCYFQDTKVLFKNKEKSFSKQRQKSRI